MQKYPFYSALSLANDLFGVEMSENQFETWGIVAYQKIGNKESLLKKVTLPVQKDNGKFFIVKPCDLSAVEMITIDMEDAQFTSSIVDRPGVYTQPVEEFIENSKIDTHGLYMSGKMIHYTEIGDRIYFNEPYNRVNILYKSYVYDSDNLPTLTQNEMTAVATYCAYCHFYKIGLMTKDSSTLQMAQMLKKDWTKACVDARQPEYMSQNEGQEILDAISSYDRHLYNKTQKIVR